MFRSAVGAIAGFLGSATSTELSSAVDAMAHRAGGALEVATGPGVGVAHAASLGSGALLFRDGQTGLMCAFDGVLFNAAELRRTLRSEVAADVDAAGLVAATFRRWGRDGFARLDGAFACALLVDGTAYLVRDPLGERVLYYATGKAAGDNALVFASESKALFSFAEVSAKPNLDALQRLLVFSFIPGEDTMFDGIQEVLPGHVLVASATQAAQHRYWQLQENIVQRDAAEHAALVSGAIQTAVERRLGGATRTAAFLSGGVDSSAVVAQLARSGCDVVAYSVGFGGGVRNELMYARLVAEHCGVEHRVIDVEPSGFVDLLPRIIWQLDDPLCDCITMPNYILAREAAAESRLVFNGEGGDPLFGGPKNKFMILGEWYAHLGGYDRAHAYLAAYHKFYASLDELCTPEFLERTGGREALASWVRPYLEDERVPSLLNRLMLLNTALKGGQSILVKVDKMLGAHGVTPASPLFDRELAELSFTIPPMLKRRDDIEKYVFKKAIEDLLPYPVVYRKKEGMGVPLNQWFTTTVLSTFARDLLSSRRARERGYFNQNVVDGLLSGRMSEHSFGRNRFGERLWMLIAIELWHQIYVDGVLSPGAGSP